MSARGDVQFIGRAVPHEAKNVDGKPARTRVQPLPRCLFVQCLDAVARMVARTSPVLVCSCAAADVFRALAPMPAPLADARAAAEARFRRFGVTRPRT